MANKSLNLKIVEPYSFALAKIVGGNFNKTDNVQIALFSRIVQDTIDFTIILRTCPELKNYLSNILISSDDKKTFIKKYFGNSFDSVSINFLYLLCDRKRIIYVEEIFTRFLEIVLKITNIYNVEIEVAQNIFALTGSNIDGNKLYNVISNWFKKSLPVALDQAYQDSYFSKTKIKFSIKENKEIFGGFRLNFKEKSKIVDFSISNKINQVYSLL